LVFRCVLGSEGCVLVPRSSDTPVATWAWPTWVVTRRRVLEAVFILLEFPSPSRRIFIGSHSLPPLWFAVSVLQLDAKWCLGVFHTVSLTFCTLKDAKLVFKPACTISRYQSCEASVLLHWTQNDAWESFGAFRLPSARKRWKTCVEADLHYFEIPKLWSIRSTLLDPKLYLAVFRSITQTFSA
jgi:hypothetical protein